MYVLWNRIIIVLIYRPCTVPRVGWEILAKKGLYFQLKNRFAELYKKVGIIECFCLRNLFPVELNMRALPHGWLKCNYFTSSHVKNKSVQRHYLVSYMVSIYGEFFFPSCVGLWIPLKSLAECIPCAFNLS